MSDPQPPQQDGAFTNALPGVPPPRPAAGSASHQDGAFTNVPPPVKMPESKPRGRRFRYLLLAAIPVALAVVAWFLGGNEVWGYPALIAGLVLALLVLFGLHVVFQRALHFDRDLDFRDFPVSVVGYLLLCWGSWTAVGYFLPLTTVRVNTGWLDKGENEPTCPLRVSYFGTVRAEAERGREASFQIRGWFDPEQVDVETLTTEGWVRRRFKSSRNLVELDKIPATWIYLDNRGNGAVTLACGKLRFAAAANRKERFLVPALPDGVRCPLTLDGTEIGALEDQHLLVDALGTRSYRWRTVTYGMSLDLLAVPLDQLADRVRRLPANAKTFRRGHVHKLPGKIDFFLQSAPEEIKVILAQSETRTELTELEP